MEKDRKRFRPRVVGCRRLFLMACLALGLICSLPFLLTSPELQWHIDHNVKLSVITPVPASKESELIAFICKRRDGIQPGGVYVVHPDGSHLRQARAHPNERYKYLNWSPDGRWMAMVISNVANLLPNEKYEIYRIRFDGLDSSRLTYNHFREYHPLWSNDGKSIWFFSDGTIHKTSINGHEVSHSHISNIGKDLFSRRPVDWSSDDQRIAGIRSYDKLLVGTNPDGSDWRVLTRAGRTIHHVAWAPNDEQIMYYTFDATYDSRKLAVFDAKGQVEDFSIEMDLIRDAQWSPDARWIAIDGRALDEEEGEYLYLLDVESGHIRYVTLIGMYHFGAISWSPDSDWIVFSSSPRSGGNSQILKVKRDGTRLQQLIDIDCEVTEISWSPR